jgi:hypothetical protein
MGGLLMAETLDEPAVVRTPARALQSLHSRLIIGIEA